MNKTTFAFLTLLALLMAAMLAYGFACGGGWAEVAQLVRLPWGATTFADVYVGLLLFSGWVVSREKNRAAGIGWAAAVLLGGNLVACAYAMAALWRSKGDAGVFWRGKQDVK